MKNSRFADSNVIITGGSSGIGFSLAKEFALQGSNLFLIARNKEKLELAAGEIKKINNNISVEIYSGDLSDPEQAEKIITAIGEKCGNIDVLINNAGIIRCGRFEDQPLSVMQEVFRINYWSTVFVTRFALKYIRKSPQPQLGFVSSVAGYTGLFGYCNYSPTKFALTGLAECLRMEMKDYNIGVTIIYPPDTQTPFLEYEHAHTLPECRALSKGAKIMSADDVAKKFMKGLLNKRFEILCNGESLLIRILKGIFPKLYYKILDGIIKKSRV